MDLFFREWCFVEQVEMTQESVLFRLNVGNPPGPFNAKAELVESFTGLPYTWQNKKFTVTDPFELALNFRYPQDYSIQLFLDDQLVVERHCIEAQLVYSTGIGELYPKEKGRAG